MTKSLGSQAVTKKGMLSATAGRPPWRALAKKARSGPERSGELSGDPKVFEESDIYYQTCICAE
jgi:hypothetical protein